MRLLVALLALALVAVPAFGSVTTASLTGRVTITGAPAAGVTVTVTSPALQEPRTTVTSARGRYRLDALPPGVYEVTFSLAKHTTLIRRAILELARVARADATLEPNPDEDSTTSTAVTVSVADTIPITTHFDDRALDRLPTGRLGSASLAPGGQFGDLAVLDGIPSGAVTSEETIEQITVVRGATPVEWETFAGAVSAFRTRSGGDDFFFTLRDTITEEDGLLHFGEATAGGRIVPQRLWFFAAAWRGETAFPYARDFDGILAKVDAQLGRAHHLDLAYRDTSQGMGFLPFESDTASLRYTAVAGTRFTSEVIAGRTQIGSGGTYEASTDHLVGRASYHLGDHVLTAGFANQEGEGPPYASFYASDRWSFSRFNVYAGVRHDDGEFSDRWTPRVAVTYDVRGNGTQAIAASWGEYAVAGLPVNALRFFSLGYATAIGNSGSARADVMRRESGLFWQNELQLDARYRLFDRFEAGATYTLVNRFQSGFQEPLVPEQRANVWLGAEVPVGEHEFGATLLQHFTEVFGRNVYSTDVALRYAIPFSRLGLLLAADATNVFQSGPPFTTPRAARFWLRVRI